MITINAVNKNGVKIPERCLTKSELLSTNGFPVYITETQYIYFESTQEFVDYGITSPPQNLEVPKNIALEIIKNSTTEEINEIVDYLITPIKQKLSL